MEERYSHGVVSVDVCSIPAANLRIGQVLILVLSSHMERRQEIVTELVPPGMDPSLVKNALRRTCQNSVINCQEPRAGIAVPIFSRNMHTANLFYQWEWKLWSV